MSGMSCGGSQITLLQRDFDYSNTICRADPFKSMSFVTKLRRRYFLLKFIIYTEPWGPLPFSLNGNNPQLSPTNLSCASAQPGNLTDPDAGPDTRIFMNPKDICFKTRHRHEILQTRPFWVGPTWSCATCWNSLSSMGLQSFRTAAGRMISSSTAGPSSNRATSSPCARVVAACPPKPDSGEPVGEG